jgi:hypothetical protein
MSFILIRILVAISSTSQSGQLLRSCCSIYSICDTFFYTVGPFFFFFFNRHYKPSWVSAWRFYRVLLTAARQTSNLEENQGFRAFQLSPQEAPSFWSDASEPSSGMWNYGREMAERILPKVVTSASFLGSFTCPKPRHGTDGFTSPPKEGVLGIFFARKIRRFRSVWTVWTRELEYQRPARYL